ncbi:MAG: HEXXH motif-containing putative peptide modification protein [Sandaracinaceae bacterium]
MKATFLTLPGEGDASLARIRKKALLVAARALLTLPRQGLSAELRRALPRFQVGLAKALEAAPAATLAALWAPDVLPLVGCVVRDSFPREESLRRLVPAFAVELHRRLGESPAKARALEPWLWDVPFETLVDRARGGALDFDAPAEGLRFSPDGVELRERGGRLRSLDELPVRARLHPISGLEAHLSELDSNPLFDHEAHPDKDGNAIDLGGHPVEAWTAALAEAASWIALALPSLAAELQHSLQRVIPVGHRPREHLSASYLEAPGTVYMTLHPRPLTLAEALIHETQHGKLNALRWLDPLLLNEASEAVSSPVRPDPRPLLGVLLAVHAFVPVAALHQRLRELGHPSTDDPSFTRRQAEVLAQNAEGLRTLRMRGRWSRQGLKVFEALSATHDELVLGVDEALLTPSMIEGSDKLGPAGHRAEPT